MLVSSWRYLGSVVGFGFGVVWTTAGLGAAIISFLLAAFGYGVAFVAERARTNAAARGLPTQTPSAEDRRIGSLDAFEPDHRRYYEPPGDELRDDETSPLAAEIEYGWSS
jgi:hypothetical protein